MPFLFQAFGKVIAVRFKRPFKNQGHSESTSTNPRPEGDSSIPTDHSNPVPAPILSSNSSPMYPVSASRGSGLEASINFSPARNARGVSLAREACDVAQVALPFAQAIVGSIPLVGAPIRAAISGLLEILLVIDRCDQNEAALVDLTSRLHRLYYHLCNAPPALDPLEQSRRDFLTRKLQSTSDRLKKLQKRRRAYTSVTQAIAGCSSDIDRYLMECLWSSQMQSQRETHDLWTISQRRQEGPHNIERSFAVPSASHLAGTVILVDATGHHHPISVYFCASYQQLNNTLRVLFERDAIEAKIQRRYIEDGEYDLCIDEGTQVTPLTSDRWSSIEPGTKIVMRVIIQQVMSSLSEVDYQCHFCRAVNRLGVMSVKYASRRQAVCSTDCGECKRRFQITRGYMKQRTPSCSSGSNHTTDAEMPLIRNFHVEQTPSWWDLEELLELNEEKEELNSFWDDLNQA